MRTSETIELTIFNKGFLYKNFLSVSSTQLDQLSLKKSFQLTPPPPPPPVEAQNLNPPPSPTQKRTRL